MREIAVRKALGSSLRDVTHLLLKEINIQFIVAMALAAPLAWHGLKTWFLSSYIHQIDLSIWMFIIPVGVLSIIIYIVIHAIAIRAFSLDVNRVLQND